MRQLDGAVIPEGADEVRLFANVHNERLRLPHLFRYYREQGVDRFFVTDDRSDDGTRDWLLDQPDTHVFEPDTDWVASSTGLFWQSELLDRFGLDRWCVVTDADEIMIWPDWERRSLRDLCAQLDERGEEAVHAVLLDMYADGPVRDVRYEAGDDPLDVCCWFDPQFRETDNAWFDPRASREFRVATFQGGMRPRVFDVDPWCSKVPLLKYRWRHVLTIGHHDVRGARRADIRAAVLHFKWLGDVAERAVEDGTRNVGHAGNAENRAYASRFAADPDLNLRGPESVAFEDSEQLVALGIMRRSSSAEDPAAR